MYLLRNLYTYFYLLLCLLLFCLFAETSNAGVELPSELCDIIMSPVSISTIYSFSFVPSIMHRIESWMIALNLKKMHLCHSMPNADVPVIKVFISLPFFYSFHYPSPYVILLLALYRFWKLSQQRNV